MSQSTIAYYYNFSRRKKLFKLTNHLGNVLATITDTKIPVRSGSSISYYTANIINATEYHPFGMRMRGRDTMLQTYNSAYRYGYNGKEQDRSITSQDYDYGMRIYDARVGRFLSVDPIAKEYPELTPYQFASNRPIDGIDLDGLEWAPPMTTDASGHLVVDNAAAVEQHLAIGRKINGYYNRSVTTAKQTIHAYEFATGKKSSLLFKAGTYFSSFFSWNGGGDYTDADDVSVLTYGKHPSGESATLTDKSLASLGMVIPFVSGGAIRKLFKGVETGIGKEAVEDVLKKVDNLSTALDEKHVTAAVNDIFGNPVINKTTGKVYDHLTEVRNALDGVENQILKLNKLIDNGKISDEVLESAKKIRSELQTKKDNITSVLDRATKKASN